MKNEFKYNRKPVPEISIGLGQYMYMLEFLSHLSIVVNCGIIYFTSRRYREYFINNPKESTQVCIGTGDMQMCVKMTEDKKLFTETISFLLFVIAIEHIVSFLKIMYVKLVSEFDENVTQEIHEDRINSII